ncbi:hypothetical protein [Anaeroplasma bactoclasticum]|jgi:hypothetical protein|nr:hypothetical protein [Anaeroplasma bactoclasticum]
MKVKNRLAAAIAALATMGHTAMSSLRNEDKDKAQGAQERYLGFQEGLESVDEILLKNTLNSIELPEEPEDTFLLDTFIDDIIINWSSSNERIISINGGTANVLHPRGGVDQKVKITASAFLRDAAVSRDFEITVAALEDDSMTIADVLNSKVGSRVSMHGIVSAFLYASGDHPEYRAGFYVTDSTGTVYVYGNMAEDVEVGDEVYVSGIKSVRFNTPQVYNPYNLTIISRNNTPSWDAVDTSKTVEEIYNLGKDAVGNVYEFDAHVSKNQYGLYTLKDINYKENGAAFKYYFAGTITPDAENYASELRGKENQIVRVKFAVGANQDWDLRGDVLDIVSYEKEEEKDSQES